MYSLPDGTNISSNGSYEYMFLCDSTYASTGFYGPGVVYCSPAPKSNLDIFKGYSSPVPCTYTEYPNPNQPTNGSIGLSPLLAQCGYNQD